MFSRLPLLHTHNVWNELVFAESLFFHPISPMLELWRCCAMTTFVIKRFVKFVVVSPPSFDCWFFFSLSSTHTHKSNPNFFLVWHKFNLFLLFIFFERILHGRECEDVERKSNFLIDERPCQQKNWADFWKSIEFQFLLLLPHSLLPSFQFLSSYYRITTRK